MNYPRLIRLLFLAFVGSGGLLPEVFAASLVRGPFLQIPTTDSIIICWRTDSPCQSVVRYGTTTSNGVSQLATNPDPTTEHQVRLKALLPDTQYFYRVESESEILAEGPDCKFTTHPLPGVSRPVRVWAMGDGGQTMDDSQFRTRDAYTRYTGDRRTDVWLALGDNAYMYGTDAEYQTNFFDVHSKMLRQIPIWSTIGNHELWTTYLGQPVAYFNIFTFPTRGEAGGVPSGNEGYYSFDYANVHFVCLDSMTANRAANGSMAEWLKADLAANTLEWVIAFFHHAPYSKGSHDSDDPYEVEMIEMRENIVPILEKYSVDLVLNGHAHVYERSYLMRGHYGFSKTLTPEMILDQGSGRPQETGAYIKPKRGTMPNEGTVYVEAGNAGSAVDQTGHHPAMFFDEMKIGSVVLDINGNRLDAIFLRNTGEINDRFTMLKQEPEPLRVCSLNLKTNQVVLRWKSLRGYTYAVERSSNGQLSGWQAVSSPILAYGATTSWTNSAPRAMDLYRVVLLGEGIGVPDPPKWAPSGVKNSE